MLIPSVDLEPLPKVYHLNVPIVDHEGRYTSAIDRRSIVRLLYGIDARRVVEIGVSRGETALTVLQNNEYIEEYIGTDTIAKCRSLRVAWCVRRWRSGGACRLR